MENINIDVKKADDGLGVQIETMFKGMEGLLSAKTIIGEAIHVDDLTILPIMEVSAGLATGAFGKAAEGNGAGAVAMKLIPVALFVVQDGNTKLINIKNQDPVVKLIDLVAEKFPDLADKLIHKGISAEDQNKARKYADAAYGGEVE